MSNPIGVDCKKCGGHNLKHRRYLKRILKGANGSVVWVTIEQLQCKDCNMTMRNLPPNILPYKHYDREIIEGVIDGALTSYDLYCEDYPSEQTMKKWITQHNNGLL